MGRPRCLIALPASRSSRASAPVEWSRRPLADARVDFRVRIGPSCPKWAKHSRQLPAVAVALCSLPADWALGRSVHCGVDCRRRGRGDDLADAFVMTVGGYFWPILRHQLGLCGRRNRGPNRIAVHDARGPSSRRRSVGAANAYDLHASDDAWSVISGAGGAPRSAPPPSSSM